MQKERGSLKKNIDWPTTIIPVAIAVFIAAMLIFFPDNSLDFIGMLRNVLVNRLGGLYMIFGILVLGVAMYIAFSRYGRIKLGNLEKPRYSNFSWFSMIFTSTMGADILYWSLTEWTYYVQEKPFGQALDAVGQQDWGSAYPYFHWGPTAWIFYILPAAAYGYMMFVKGRHRNTLAEACRPLLGKRVDGVVGKTINIFSLVSAIVAAAATFTFISPVLSMTVSRILGVDDSIALSITLLIITALLYSIAVLTGIQAIKYTANLCVGVFFIFMVVVILGGDPVYMLESGLSGIGKMLQNFLGMSTWADPLRLSGDGVAGFPQNWTVFYWGYWIAWFVSTPFFIAKVSEGRTIRQTIIGGLGCGLAGTYTSFTILSNYGLQQHMTGNIDVIAAHAQGASPASIVAMIMDTLPLPTLAMGILCISMILFNITTFDAVALVVSGYSQKHLKKDEEPHRILKAFWCVVLLIVPIGLLIIESDVSVIQMFCIVAAFPLAIIMGIIIISFIKELRADMPPEPAIEMHLIPEEDEKDTNFSE